jgi:hypothetical protein
VWHCSVRAATGDRMLSDDEWAQVACEIMHRTGLAPYGQDDAVRWVAVRHADDHIHLLATLARQDGTRPRLWNDFYRVGEACRVAEERFGLRRTAPRDRTAPRRPTRAESEKARRRGFREAPRVTLRRAVSTAAAGASSEDEFFARLEAAGVLVRKRFSTRNPGEITGYAVALPTDTTRTGGPVWFGGGKLAADLTLPKLRHRWTPTRTVPAERFTPAERNAIWEHAARTAADAARQIRHLAATDPVGAADAAWAAADTLHAAASTLGSRVLRQAADAYDRAARAPYGRIPRPSHAGNSLRRTARATVHRRLHQRRPHLRPDRAHRPARRTRRGRGRPAPGTTACCPGSRRAQGGRKAPRGTVHLQHTVQASPRGPDSRRATQPRLPHPAARGPGGQRTRAPPSQPAIT